MNLPLDPNEDAELHLVIEPYNYTLQVENLVAFLEGWNLLLLCKNRIFPSDQDPGLVTHADAGVGVVFTHIFPHLCRWIIEITYLPVFHLIWAIPLVITLVEHWKEHQSFWYCTEGRSWVQTMKYCPVLGKNHCGPAIPLSYEKLY